MNLPSPREKELAALLARIENLIDMSRKDRRRQGCTASIAELHEAQQAVVNEQRSLAELEVAV